MVRARKYAQLPSGFLRGCAMRTSKSGGKDQTERLLRNKARGPSRRDICFTVLGRADVQTWKGGCKFEQTHHQSTRDCLCSFVADAVH